MIRLSTALIAGIAALPLIASAQTANAPGGQASTGTPLDQTTKSPSSTPKTTRTSPDATNPSGSLPSKGTSPATDSMPNASDTTATPTKSSRRAAKQANTTKTGDVPTYPAPAPDGTPTK